jgi:hypothetical protein
MGNNNNTSSIGSATVASESFVFGINRPESRENNFKSLINLTRDEVVPLCVFIRYDQIGIYGVMLHMGETRLKRNNRNLVYYLNFFSLHLLYRIFEKFRI